MARGVIPITFKKGGLPEIIKNEENGYLVEDTNEEDLAKAIVKVLQLKEEERKKIQDNAINTANKFTIRNTIEQLDKTYERL